MTLCKKSPIPITAAVHKATKTMTTLKFNFLFSKDFLRTQVVLGCKLLFKTFKTNAVAIDNSKNLTFHFHENSHQHFSHFRSNLFYLQTVDRRLLYCNVILFLTF